jgi:hypothetical protein
MLKSKADRKNRLTDKLRLVKATANLSVERDSMARKETFRMAVVLVTVLGLLTGLAAAQDLNTFDNKLVAQFNPADSPDTIPTGTRITTANWQQYRKFLTISLQAFMSGKYFWKMG